jgi:hypothetical protein
MNKLWLYRNGFSTIFLMGDLSLKLKVIKFKRWGKINLLMLLYIRESAIKDFFCNLVSFLGIK